MRYFLYEFVYALQALLRRLRVVYEPLVCAVVPEQCPQLLQEAEAAVYAVGVPRLGSLHRAKEHLVQAQGVCTIVAYDVVWVDDVVHRLRHLLYRPATLVFAFGSFGRLAAVLEYELSVLVFRAPVLEGLSVENVVFHKVDPNVYWCHVLVVLALAEAHEHRLVGGGQFVGAIHEVAAALNHSLVHQFLERLFLAAHSIVV